LPDGTCFLKSVVVWLCQIIFEVAADVLSVLSTQLYSSKNMVRNFLQPKPAFVRQCLSEKLARLSILACTTAISLDLTCRTAFRLQISAKLKEVVFFPHF
jgi:hypothetical protein